jgi:hypothetical protein
VNIALPYRHQRKPARILGVDWGHALAHRLVACVPLTEAAGAPVEYVRQQVADEVFSWSNTPYGPAMLTADGVGGGGSFGDLAAYDTNNDLTAACLLNVLSWSTATSGDFFWGKNTFQTRGWILLNNGTFADQVGFRQDRGGSNDYAATTRAAVGTGLMLFIGRRTGNTIEFLTAKAGTLTQHVSLTPGAMPSPAGAELSMATSNANGTVQVLSAWLWSYALPDAALRELYQAPFQMFRTPLKARFMVPAAPSTTIPRMMHHFKQQGIA